MPEFIDILAQPGQHFGTSQISYDLSHDEGGYAWAAQIGLASIDDYQRLNIGDPVVLNVEGTDYHLIVDSKALDRGGPAEVRLQFTAISPIALLTQPWVLPYSKTWEDPVMASVVAAEIAAMANLQLSWRILDWMIPAGLLTIEEGEPLDAILDIATAAGATVQSAPDGTIIVRNLYPLSPQDYDTTAPDQILEDTPDKISVSSPVAMGPYFNYLEVGDEEITAETGDTIEFIADEDDPLRGVLRVYPYPWRTAWTLSNTGPLTIVLNRVGEIALQDEPEMVTFRDFEANTKYPIYSLDNVEWNAVDLGALEFDQYTSKLKAGSADPYGYSMALVTYTKRFIEYTVSGQFEDTGNIIMLEEV